MIPIIMVGIVMKIKGLNNGGGTLRKTKKMA